MSQQDVLDETPDAPIIGANPPGATAARILAQSGVSMTGLPQGGWGNRGDLPSDKLQRDVLAAGRWSVDPNVRAGSWDYPIGVTESDVRSVNSPRVPTAGRARAGGCADARGRPRGCRHAGRRTPCGSGRR